MLVRMERGKATGSGSKPSSTRGPVALGSLAGRAIEPALLRRAGLTVSIAGNWPAIVGPRLAATTRPLRIKWGRRPGLGEPPAPGTLVIACDGATALRVQHEADQIVERVNAVHGRGVIGAVRIEQRHIAPAARAPRPPEPTPAQAALAGRIASRVRDDRLRTSLARLGARVIAAAASTSSSNMPGETIADGRTPRTADRTEPDR